MSKLEWPPMELQRMFANIEDVNKRPHLYNVPGVVALLERQANECEAWLKLFRAEVRKLAAKHGGRT